MVSKRQRLQRARRRAEKEDPEKREELRQVGAKAAAEFNAYESAGAADERAQVVRAIGAGQATNAWDKETHRAKIEAANARIRARQANNRSVATGETAATGAANVTRGGPRQGVNGMQSIEAETNAGIALGYKPGDLMPMQSRSLSHLGHTAVPEPSWTHQKDSNHKQPRTQEQIAQYRGTQAESKAIQEVLQDLQTQEIPTDPVTHRLFMQQVHKKIERILKNKMRRAKQRMKKQSIKNIIAMET